MNNLPAIAFGIWTFAIVGWVLNLIWVIQAVTGQALGNIEVTGMLILQVLGIFVAPLGSILGYIGIFI